MKRFVFCLAALLPLILFAQSGVAIIPQPLRLQIREGSFTIDENTAIHFSSAHKEVSTAAAFLRNHIDKISGYHLPVNKRRKKQIILTLTPANDLGQEGYHLTVDSMAVQISAPTKAGIIYGMQSLFQLLPAVRTNAPLTIPALEIEDKPRFPWRGMHLDVSRHFFTPDLVKEFIDLMAAYKLNTFHWHLVDDQGWRIEIKKYPALTQTGAWRVDQTNKPWSDRPQALAGETPTYGGYYTQQQIKEIVAYAAQRNVTIVPEIEMPGHVASALAAYPQLSCTQQPQLPLTGGNYMGMSSNYCAGNDEVFTFLENVLSEVIALFPSTYIHIGGDEVDKGPWKKCSRCQARMKAKGLKNEEELQSYFIKRIEQFLISKKRKMIGWDEILEGGLAPEATVMSWRGEAGGIQAARMGHNVVMTPGTPLYFDHYQGGPEGEPLAIGGMNTLKKVYTYDPIPKELTKEQGNYILGAQANLWTEYITTAEHVEYMVLPRMLALAEVVWSAEGAKDWTGFNQRLQRHFRAFDQQGLHYSKGNYKVDIKPIAQEGRLLVHLSTEAINSEIRYTTDGSIPTANSNRYTGPVRIDSSLVLKAVTVQNSRVMGLVPAEQTFALHKAVGRSVQYTYPFSRYYPADGPNSLTDGVRGKREVGKYWHGWNGRDLIATVDLGSEQSISTLTLGCLQHYRDWIFLPQWVKFEVSPDGITYKEVKTVSNPVSVQNQAMTTYDFSARFAQQQVRFVRVTAKILDACPPGHSGEGKPAWLFADELIVN